MKILLISDTHGFHKQLMLPSEVDMIICSGDVTNQKNPAMNANEAINFLEWYDKLNVQYKVLIAGNHDTSIEAGLVNPKHYGTITYLQHEFVVIEGIKIFGSPYTPRFHNWAWNVDRGQLSYYWDDIPKDTDILVTHGPPLGVLDFVSDWDGTKEHVGDAELLSAVLSVEPRIHMFGHIHDNGKLKNNGIKKLDYCTTEFHNCSMVTDQKFNLGLTSQGHLIEM